MFYKVATLLRCGGILSNHLITNFPRNVPVKIFLKIGQYLAKIWTKVCGLLFGPPCTVYHRPTVVHSNKQDVSDCCNVMAIRYGIRQHIAKINNRIHKKFPQNTPFVTCATRKAAPSSAVYRRHHDDARCAG